MKTFDIIIIGAGSIGLSCAWAFSERNLSVLILEKENTFAQGQNKAAIGGVRGAHSEEVKIDLCLKSIKVFSQWKEKYGDDIHWHQGGYLYPAYNTQSEKILKGLLKIQQKNNLNIQWIAPDEISAIVKGIKKEDLRGGSFSREDGHLSPLLTAASYFKQAKRKSAVFRFNERVLKISDGEVVSDKGRYSCNTIILCIGAANPAPLLGFSLPIAKERHEAAITEAVPPITGAMVVDIEKKDGAGSFYFYQTQEGQLIFCLSPEPPVISEKPYNTSSFLPMASRRMLDLLGFAGNIKVRRSWAGFYPVTPDGSPFVDSLNEGRIYFALGMCGQGLMLGPGIALNLVSKVLDGSFLTSERLMFNLRADRVFTSIETLK